MSDVSGITHANGRFIVTDSAGNASTVDLATLMMMLNITLTDNYDTQLSARMEEMQKRSDNMKQMTEALNILRSEASSGTSTGAYASEKILAAEKMLTEAGMTITTRMTQDTMPAGKGDYWSAAMRTGNVLTGGGNVNYVKNGLETLIESVKSSLESMGNDSQLDNIKLQNLMQKRSNSFEMTTKVMDTDKQTVQSIIRNL